MEEKMDLLYKEYLNRQLDSIFMTNGDVETPNLIIGNPTLYEHRNNKNGYNYDVYSGKRSFSKVIINDKLVPCTIYGYSKGYALIEDFFMPKANFLDENNNLVSDVWYDEVNNYINGYATARIGNKYFYLDENRRPVNSKGYSYATDFKDGYAIVTSKDENTFDIIDTNFKIVFSFSNLIRRYGNGFDLVTSYSSQQYFLINPCYGYYLSAPHVHHFLKNGLYYFDESSDKIVIFYYVNGKELFNCPKEIAEEITTSSTHINIERNVQFNPDDIGNYKVKKGFTNYICERREDKKVIDRFTVKYKPIKRFSYRYTLCIHEDTYYLYDRNSNSYPQSWDFHNIIYDDNFIYDKKEDKVYFIYENNFLEITEYYINNLIDKRNISINKSIKEILNRTDFSYRNMDKVDELLQEEKERKKKDDEKKKKEQEEKERQEKLKRIEEQMKRLQAERDRVEQNEKEALAKIREGLAVLKDNGVKNLPVKKVEIENIFAINDNHKEIDSKYINLLMVIDLLNVRFTNVKVNGIDFRGTNIEISDDNLNPQTVYNKDLSNCNFEGVYISPTVRFTDVNINGIDFRGTNIEIGGYNLNPQTVYNKDLSNCNFEGIHISPLANFTGVNIKGTKFSIDNNPMTMDVFNVTFKDAIYDENTTYNGTSFYELFGIKRK